MKKEIIRKLIGNYRFIYQELWRYDKRIFLFDFLKIIFSVFSTVYALIIPALFIGLLEKKVMIQNMVKITLIMFLLYGVICALRDYLTYRNEWQYIEFRGDYLHRKISRKAMDMHFSLYEKEDTQKLLNSALSCVSGNSSGIEKLLKDNVVLVISSLNLLTYVVLVAQFNPYIILLLLAFSLIELIIQNRANDYEINNRDKKAKCEVSQKYINMKAYDVNAGKDIRVYQLHNWLDQLFHTSKLVFKGIVRKEKEKQFCSDFVRIFLDLLKGVVCYGYLLYQVTKGMDISLFVLYIGVISGFTAFFTNISKLISDLIKNLNLTSFYLEFLKLNTSEESVKNVEVIVEDNDTFSIEFVNVTFKYPKTNRIILDDVSFKIEKGKKIALVGINGAGKSTIVKLLCNFYTPDSGKILINGIDINCLNLTSYYNDIAAIFQEAFVYSFSIYDNITNLQGEDSKRTEFKNSLKKADLWNKVNLLEQKEDTFINKDISEDGIQLSGGELQKLMLAKALYKKAKMLLLDEPTAALDAMAEADMYRKYDELINSKTAIFISHRLASTRFCDEIFLLNNGKIQERGTHLQLMECNGEYAKMFNVQSQYYMLRGYIMGKEKFKNQIKIFLTLICLEEKKAGLFILGKGLVSGILPFFNLYVYAQIINYILARDFRLCIRYISVLLIGTLLLNFFVAICEQWLNYLKQTCAMTLDRHIAYKAYTMDYENYEKQETMDSLRRTNNTVVGAGGLDTQIDTVTLIIQHIISILIATYYLIVLFTKVDNSNSNFFTSSVSTVVMIIVYFAIVIIGFIFAGNVQKVFSILQLKNDHVNSVTSYLSNLMTDEKNAMSIRIENLQDAFESLLKKYNKEVLGNYFDAGKKGGKNYAVVAFMGQIAVAMTYIIIGGKSIYGIIDIGDVFLYAGAMNKFMGAFGELIPKISGFMHRTSYLELYYKFLNTSNEPEDTEVNKIPQVSGSDMEIEFVGVSFKYPGTNNIVLDNINLKLISGKKVAIVGKNGAGKTTIVKLICRLYKPTEGKILINGVDINTLDYVDYIKLFSVVFQDYELFSFPIVHNIAGSLVYNDNKIYEVLNKVNIIEKINAMEEGIHSQLYNNNGEGFDISGGEAQKLAIARALYKDGNYVVLDEPTAALDPIAEAEVYEQFDKLINKKGALYISHRMSSCKFCDEIIVLNEGKITEYGSHEKLIQQRGIYYELFNAQAKYYCV